MRTRTIDKGVGPPPGAMEVHTAEQLGPNMSKLPNGFLLCRNVPIARAGWLIYGPREVPVRPGDMGVSHVERTIDALIDEKTIKSFNGAAVVNDHPPDDVTPESWKKVSVGFTLNVRRGTGDDADVLLADLMITDKAAIADVLSGKREVSAGYDADYRDDGGGIGRQFNIIGNHIALVEKGRCGPRCAIGDQDYQPPPTSKELKAMTQRVKLRGTPRTALTEDQKAQIRQRAQDAVADLEALENDEGGEEGQHIHIHMDGATQAASTGDASTLDKTIDAKLTEKLAPMQGTLDKLTALFEKYAPTLAKTADAKDDDYTADSAQEKESDSDEVKAKKKAWREKMKAKDAAANPGEGSNSNADPDPKKAPTGDSAALETGYTALIAQAEVLVPGFKVPTFDAALNRAATIDRMCATRRKALDAFLAHDAAAPALLKGLNDGQEVDTVSMTCDAVATMFKSASAAKAALNNAAATASGKTAPTKTGDAAMPTGGAKPKSWAEINKACAEFWEPRLLKQ